MLKKLALTIICFSLATAALIAPMSIAATSDITVTLDGTELEFDIPPQIVNDRTMVPMRVIFEALGASVEWDADTRSITALKDETVVFMQIDSTIMLVDDKEIVIDAPPMLIDGRTLVPVRAISEGLDMYVRWDIDTRTVVITSQEYVSSAQPVALAYVDPLFRMTLLINNPEWTFYRQRDPEQVFFFNSVNPSADSLIAISAFPSIGDISQEIAMLWEEMREAYMYMLYGFEYGDKEVLQIGVGEHRGYLRAFSAELSNGGTMTANVVFWSANGIIYICTTTANEQTAEEVQNVLDGILSSFMSMPHMM